MQSRQKKRFHLFCHSVKRELTKHKGTFVVYLLLRILVIAVMVLQLFNQNYENAFLCVLTLFLMILPSVAQATFRVTFPSALEVVQLLFIFAAEILGEISAFYLLFPYWDTILHTLNGFLCAAIGFSLVDIMNRQPRLQFQLSPLFTAIVSFCFSMTIGILWEFFEFGMDMLFHLDMQKDTVIHAIHSVMLDPTQQNVPVSITQISETVVNGQALGLGGYLDIGLIDTMEDLFVNFVGALVFSVCGYFYVRHRHMNSIIQGFVPVSQESTADTLQTGKED